MKLGEAISRADEMTPNSCSKEEKIKWLSTLDGLVKEQIIDTHTDSDKVLFSGYDETTDTQAQLLIPAPFDMVYVHWLEAQIHYANGEIKKYNNAVEVFNTELDAYKRFYNRCHMPIGKGRRFLF